MNSTELNNNYKTKMQKIADVKYFQQNWVVPHPIAIGFEINHLQYSLNHIEYRSHRRTHFIPYVKSMSLLFLCGSS